MKNGDVGKPGHKRADESAHQILETARKLLTSDLSASGGLTDEGDGPEEGLAGLSDGFVLLVVLIAEMKSRDHWEVLERLREAMVGSTGLADLIAETVTAGESGDFLGVLNRVTKIVIDAKLDRLIVPSRRRPRRPDVVTYRVRIDLRGTKPPLWRRLELASNLLLDEVNKIIQTTFNWTDTHLHHFASGSDPYGPDTEAYLCPYAVKEGKDGVPEHEVRLDEVLVDVGDKLSYVYDYGDNWRLVIKLEAILARDGSVPQAVCTAGRRPNPPEDCGGVHGYEQIAAAPDSADPETLTLFDVEEINEMLIYSTQKAR